MLYNRDEKEKDAIASVKKKHKCVGFLIYLLLLAFLIFLLLWGYFGNGFPSNLDKYIYIRDEPIKYQTLITDIYSEDDPNHQTLDPSTTLKRKIDMMWEVIPKRQKNIGDITYIIESITNENGIDISHIIYLEFDESVNEIWSNEKFSVLINIKMNEPKDQAEYELVAGHQVTIKLSIQIKPLIPETLKATSITKSLFCLILF